MKNLGPLNVKAWWFNPRTAETAPHGELPGHGEHEFAPPASVWPGDWVLVLDDALRDCPAPAIADSRCHEPVSRSSRSVADDRG